MGKGNLKKTFAFIFLMLTALLLGGFIAHVCEGRAGVGWLALGKEVGFENISLDLYAIKLNFGLMINATVSQIFTIAAALIIFNKTCKNL